jgi:hypothetical protein
MWSKAFWVIFLLVAMASARVVTWTAYSEESQAAADEAAIAGVARQISAQVDATTTLRHSEKTIGNDSKESKSIQTQSSVRSDVFLKGLKVKKLPKDGKRFGTTASIDLDELTSLYQFKLAEIQKKVSDLEVRAEKALQNKEYEEAARLLSEIPSTARPYTAIVEEMSFYTPVDTTLRLKTRDKDIRDSLVRTLRGLEIKAEPNPASPLKAKSDETLSIILNVSKQGAALSGLSFYLEGKGKVLAEATTNSNGEVTFQIPASQIPTAANKVLIMSKLPLDIRTAAAISTITYSLQIERPQCNLKLNCKEYKSVCAAVRAQIAKNSGTVVESSKAVPTSIRIQANPTRTLNQLTTYSVNLSLSKGDKKCQQEKAGTGRTEEEAIANAIKKMDLNECQTSLEICQ